MKKTNLSRYNNDWFYPGPKIKVLLWYMVGSSIINSWLPMPSSVKRILLRTFGAKIGCNVVIKPKVNIKYPWKLTIGNNVWLGENVWIDNLAHVNIGDNVCISQGALLLCGNHNYTKATFDLIVKDIYLEEGSWVGAKSIVCPGVTLKSHSILTAGSVATRDLDSYLIYQGNPAIQLRARIITE